uniref:Uncharacterized protein n=1 Tax=Nelumbo nucifera TaxID=4432 RepID=A0A822XFZ5_NELNU|nr:TPA_asm: hypothetical protein HUJ06_019484 [Nelumbo nucifera]
MWSVEWEHMEKILGNRSQRENPSLSQIAFSLYHYINKKYIPHITSAATPMAQCHGFIESLIPDYS